MSSVEPVIQDSSDPLLAYPGSESKVLRSKRNDLDSGGKTERSPKSVKMTDLKRVPITEGVHMQQHQFLENKKEIASGEKELCQVTEDHAFMNSNTPQGQIMMEHTISFPINEASSALHRKPKICTANESTPEDRCSLENQNPFHSYRNLDRPKSRASSECGSSIGPLNREKKESLQVWKEMKQNGFISLSQGGIPVPKQRGRKNKNDVLKKRMEHAKKENADKIVKMAGSSGLLNQLNPGIINHVRNTKQVHSIIEALVKSEKFENEREKSRLQTTIDKEICGRNKIPGNTNVLGNKQTQGYPTMQIKQSYFSSLVKNVGESHIRHDSEDDIGALKLSSFPALASENLSCSLSVQAATVAYQWLELLHQDVKGRLAELRRSRRRVRTVIQIELPCLVSKEFSSNQENDAYIVMNSGKEYSYRSTAKMHQAKWDALFRQMDSSLFEEEKELESWLIQVNEMQLHCGWALQQHPLLKESETVGKNIKSVNPDNSEKDLAVRAAAAAIYSTCNFLSSTENVSCF